MMTQAADRRRRRFDRQINEIARLAPRMGGALRTLMRRRWFLVRLPVALLLIAGGLLSVLPVLGLWMLPLGLLLLAVDLPFLQGPITTVLIRVRRWLDLRRMKREAKAKARTTRN